MGNLDDGTHDEDGAAQYGGDDDEGQDGVRAPMEAKFDTLYGNHQDPRMLAAAQAAQYGLNRQQREAPPVSPLAAWRAVLRASRCMAGCAVRSVAPLPTGHYAYRCQPG